MTLHHTYMKSQIMNVNCETCTKTFDKAERQIKKTKHNFCSRRCSNIKSNETRWKSHIKNNEKCKCKGCGKFIDYRSKRDDCQSCHNLKSKEKNKNITIGEMKNKHNIRKNPQWYSSEIRNFARDWNPHLVGLPCQVCHYKPHTELCHLKSIGEATDNVTLGEINDEGNLVVLCRNHHWELDHGLLEKTKIPLRT